MVKTYQTHKWQTMLKCTKKGVLMMKNSAAFSDLSNKIIKLFESSPIADANKNVHALIQGALTKMELVSREEYDIQVAALQQARIKLESMETKLNALESMLKNK
jgi:ubiquinone biosynthesis accessory factor UbiK